MEDRCDRHVAGHRDSRRVRRLLTRIALMTHRVRRRRRRRQRSLLPLRFKSSSFALSLGNALAAGVFLSAGLCHMLVRRSAASAAQQLRAKSIRGVLLWLARASHGRQAPGLTREPTARRIEQLSRNLQEHTGKRRARTHARTHAYGGD